MLSLYRFLVTFIPTVTIVVSKENEYWDKRKSLGIALANGNCVLFPLIVIVHYYRVLGTVHMRHSLKALLQVMRLS